MTQGGPKFVQTDMGVDDSVLPESKFFRIPTDVEQTLGRSLLRVSVFVVFVQQHL